MAAKPSDTARWANVGGDILVPVSGKKDVGFGPRERIAPQYLDYLLNLSYQWHQYLSDGDLTGEHTFNSLVTIEALHLIHASPSEAGMLMRAQNPLGYARATIDRNGYRMGHLSEWVEDWKASTLPAYWSETGTGSAAIVGPWASLNQRNMAMLCNNTQATTVVPEYIAFFDQSVVYAQEWDIWIGTDFATGGGQILRAGIQCETGNDFEFRAEDSTWTTETGATSNTADENVADETRYRLKIEMVGDQNHAGSNELVRFYINDVLEDEMAVTVADTRVRPFFYLENTNLAQVMEVEVGRIRACWNHSLSPDEI